MSLSYRLAGALSIVTLMSLQGSLKAAPRDMQSATNSVAVIDLPTALRLAGAQNLDVQIARHFCLRGGVAKGVEALRNLRITQPGRERKLGEFGLR